MDPADGPVGLLSNTRDYGICQTELQKTTQSPNSQLDRLTGINGIEEIGSLLLVLDVRVDKERVGLRMDILHHDLESIEAASFRNLNFTTKSLNKVLVHDAIRCSEEGENVRDEEAFIVIKAIVPVWEVLGKVNLFGRPERCLGLLVHLPDLIDIPNR